MHRIGALLAAVLATVLVACTGSNPETSDAATTDTSTHDASGNCVPPGTPGNELGIGGYCDPKNGPPCRADAGFRICSGGVAGVPEGNSFCTAPCSRDEDCGSNALCLTNAIGTGCVPLSCAGDAAVGHD